MIKLPDWKDPIIFALLVVLVIAIVLNIAQRWQLSNARDALTTMTAKRDAALRDAGALELERNSATAANEAFARIVQEQGNAIISMRAEADARQSKAGAAARAVLKERPRLPAGHGPTEMNAWLVETFAPAVAH